MDSSYIKNEIQLNYSMNIDSIEKVKNSYKIETNKGCYGIKVIKYRFSHFYFIYSAIEHLQKRGFNNIPKILKTKNEEGFIKLGNNYAYLNEWIDCRNTDYKSKDELSLVSRKLGELHKCSEGFNINRNMKPRIGWYSWIKVFETRCEEILDFKKRIFQKTYKSEFDLIYLDALEEEIERGKKAISELKEFNYYEQMDKEVFKRGFCHHDYAYHNVLIDKKGELNVIDFDYCILDTHIHDIGSLLIRSMKDGRWNKDTAKLIIDNYSLTNNISKDQLKLMKAFIGFPQGFWQIGLQYYWEQQPWGEEFLIKKINKYLDDRKARERFLEDFI
ncbi:CotS family spore coat protein [Clostridium sp.]|uniref:CotS family spore coat protein n=1 Tax=Clostridium sp. TaxID=1506 RepID=UPI002612EE16|nr:CotS family spore coat protein [Clostridium sp.]